MKPKGCPYLQPNGCLNSYNYMKHARQLIIKHKLFISWPQQVHLKSEKIITVWNIHDRPLLETLDNDDLTMVSPIRH